MADSSISDAVLHEVALTREEYDAIVARLGRPPNAVELGMFGAMWSEHCGYKNSKPLLRRLPTTGPRVLQGPGENAGAVDIGDGQALVLKIESHNHPSAVEPYQGASTAPPSPRSSSRLNQRSGALPCRSVIPLRRSCCSRRASRCAARAPSSGCRISARRA